MARTGRPRSFDRDPALASALGLFWRHGYEVASLEGLRRAMGGLSSASFYAAFGSKELFYHEALGLYLHTHGLAVALLSDLALSRASVLNGLCGQRRACSLGRTARRLPRRPVLDRRLA